MELLAVPLVNAPLAAFQSTSLLFEDGVSFIKDGLDQKGAYALWKSHKAKAMSIRAAAT